jgi:hypothetical protein
VQRFGSVVYQRFADYHGPQFDIQTGYQHQGYGSTQYDGFFGTGSMYIDLAMARVYDPAYNCTRGFRVSKPAAEPSFKALVVPT